MTQTQKVETLRALLSNDETAPDDDVLAVYLSVAEHEILSWRYSFSEDVTVPQCCPPEYEMTQIYAVLAGLTTSGGEGETAHSENGISRTFRYPDMMSYVRANVRPICKVV